MPNPDAGAISAIVLPFNVACGHCKNCERGYTDYCLTAQPKQEWAGAAYGFADMGPWPGGQAELLRVLWGDFNCLRLGEDVHRQVRRMCRGPGRETPGTPRRRPGRRLASVTHEE